MDRRKCAIDAGGPLLPGLWSPRFFFAFVDSDSLQGARLASRELESRTLMPTSVSGYATVTARRSPRPLPSFAMPRRSTLGRDPRVPDRIRIENGLPAVPLRKQADNGPHRHSHTANARPSAHDAVVASDSFESRHGTDPMTPSRGHRLSKCAARFRFVKLPGAPATESDREPR